jgi:hypothetical protein
MEPQMPGDRSPTSDEKLFWVAITIFGGAFATGLFFVIEQAHVLGGIIVALFGLIGLVFLIRDRCKKIPVRLPLVIVAAAMVWLAIGYDYYDRHRSKVGPPYKKFESIYNSYRDQLGVPKPFIESGSVSFDAYQNAKIAYIESIHSHLILNESKQTWYAVRDTELANRLIHLEDRRKYFPSIPLPLEPPIGGIARLWLQNPDAWKWIGWRRWGCTTHDGRIKYQEFDQGYIIGPVPASEDSIGTQNGQLLVLERGGAYRALSITEQIPCDKD